MRDLDLWRRLCSEDDREIASDLRELAALPMVQRGPFLGFVERLLRHERPDLRAAAVSLLAGARGVSGIARIVDALDDDDVGVREAAVAALRITADTTPARWAHAVFHPRPDVRRLALLTEPPAKAAHYGAYLRADPAVAELAREQPWPAKALPLAMHLHLKGAATDADVEQVLLRSGPNDVRGLMLRSLRRPYDRVRWVLSEAERRAELPKVDGFDLFDNWCRAVSASTEHRGKLLQQMAEAVLGNAPPPLRHRLAVSALQHAAAEGLAEHEDFLRLVAACYPRSLLFPGVPISLRRTAIFGLHRHRDHLDKEIADVARQLFDAGLAERDDGGIDLTVAAILAAFHASKQVLALVLRFTEAKLVDAAAAQPEAWPVLAQLPDESGGGPQWFIERLKHRPEFPRFLAVGLPIWQRMTGAAAKTKKAPLFTRLLKTLDSATQAEILVALGRVSLEMHAPIGTRALERLVDQLEPNILARDLVEVFLRLLPLAETDTDALAVLERCARRREAKAFAKAMLGLDLLSLVRLLELTDGSITLQRAKEHALAKALENHADEAVRSWASRILAGFKALPSRAPPAAIPGIRHLTEKQAATITDATAEELDDALAPAVAAASIGLVPALAARKDPSSPHLTACVALVGCADGLTGVGEQLDRFGSSEEKFIEALRAAIIENWQGRKGLPILCHAFLHRWELHGFAVLQWIDKLKGGLAEAIRSTLEVDNMLVRHAMFEGIASAVLLRRYRQPARVAASATAEVVTLLVEQLDTDLGVWAARMLVAFHLHGAAKSPLERLRPRVVYLVADMSKDAVRELARWVRVDGLKARSAPARPHVSRLRADRLMEIRRSLDVDALTELCESRNPKVVHEATLRLIELGGRGHAKLVELLRRTPAASSARTITDSIPLWTDNASLAEVAKIAADAATTSEMRFRIAMALCERGEEGWVERAMLAAREPCESLWLTTANWEALRVRCGDDLLLCVTLAVSPHPHAYQRAITWLVESGRRDDETKAALAEFLEMGMERPVYLRRAAARRLMELRETVGLPVCLGHVLDNEYRPYRWLYDKIDAGTLDRVVDHILDATLLGGREACHEERCLELTKSKVLPVQAHERAFRRMLLEGTDPVVRQKVVSTLGFSFGREVKLGRVAEIFAWGVRKGRELTGRLFRVHMTERRQDFGYTRFNENSIYVSPLPVLRSDRHGRDIVEGLVLHEFGHHMYHRSVHAQKVWRRAHKEGIGSILNLVADEHLERNLRAVESAYGDRLKRLAAYAFQHADREIRVDQLLNMLLGSAAEALCERPLGVAFDDESVEVHGGQLLRELDRCGHPFARFVRAMRMGLGNRTGDPVLQRALDLFKGNFRHNDMQELYRIAVKLSEMYGSESTLADTFGGHEGLEWGERDASIHGDGLVDDDVQQEVERILNPKRRKASDKPGKPGGKLQINVSGEAEFQAIDRVERVRPDRDQHRMVAMEVRRHAERLRHYLTELGLALVPRRGRLRGRAFDRTRARAVVLRRDPRMLVAREIEVHSDLFIGVVIDCSGSMSSGGSMAKAHRFGVLIAEACRTLHGVDARFFGFTDRVIFDAGDKHNCAVTSLQPTGGNNDAAGLYYAASVAAASSRKSKLLVMISDGLPTECSVAALRNLVAQLTRRRGILCAQVAVRALEEVCFPHYIELTEPELDRSVRRFGEIISGLARRALGR